MSKAPEYDRCEHQTLSFNLPVLIFLGKKQDLLCDIHDALRVMLGDTVQDIQRIDSHVGLRVGQANQSVVQEDIKPLLVEFLLLTNQVGLTSINCLIIADVILEVLYDLYPEIEVMLRVTIYQFAYVLTLVWALLNNMAIILEQVVYKELIEVGSR